MLQGKFFGADLTGRFVCYLTTVWKLQSMKFLLPSMITLLMDEVGISEMSGSTYKTVLLTNPEDGNLRNCSLENVKRSTGLLMNYLLKITWKEAAVAYLIHCPELTFMVCGKLS